VLEDSDKRQFSRALSGFANSDGGILIWGVETNKQEQAAKLKPINSVFDFQAALKKSILNSTQPVVDGIVLEVITSASSTSDGYVKCLIPASDKTPHRAMLWDREYFKRTTEGFYKLEHFDLEDMFGRRPRPLLSLSHEVVRGSQGGGPAGSWVEVKIIIKLHNSGRGSARAPYIEITASSPFQVFPNDSLGKLLHFSREAQSNSSINLFGTSDFLLHPNTTFNIASVEATIKEKDSIPSESLLHCRLAAENFRLTSIDIRMTGEEVRKAIGRE
jgi:hypothetical protein